MNTNCDGVAAHDLGNGWLVCTPCKDDLEDGWAREQLPYDQDAQLLVDETVDYLRHHRGGAA
jgi:hypothetical protein